VATVLPSNNNNSLNSSESLVSFSGIYMLFLSFKRKCIYIIPLLGSNMNKEVRRIIKQIEKQTRNPNIEYYDTLNTLYFELYLCIDQIVKGYEEE